MEINPGYAPAANGLGEAYWRLRRYDDAQRVLQGSIWLDSTSAAPYVVLGKVYIAKRQLRIAERTLRRGVALEPGSYTAHYFLGQVYSELGNQEAAARELRTAAQIQQRQTQDASRIR
jgi:tetratricopeptide (TPR) repeat protein